MNDFAEYLKRYCLEYKVEPEEAIKHMIVRLVGFHYGLNDKQIKECLLMLKE